MKMLDVFKLRGVRLLIRLLSTQTVEEDAIIYRVGGGGPEDDTHNRGIVERVGAGERLRDGTVRPVQGVDVGDLVYFAKFAGTKIMLDRQPRLVLMEDELQGSVDGQHFEILEHRDEDETGAKDHLVGENCSICMEKAAEAARATQAATDAIANEQARKNLDDERERLRTSVSAT